MCVSKVIDALNLHRSLFVRFLDNVGMLGPHITTWGTTQQFWGWVGLLFWVRAGRHSGGGSADLKGSKSMETAPLRIGHICVVECVSAPSVCLHRINNSPVLADRIAEIAGIANSQGKAQNGRRQLPRRANECTQKFPGVNIMGCLRGERTLWVWEVPGESALN